MTPSTAATRAETARIAEHQAALDDLRKLGRPLAPPDPVAVIDMRRDALVEKYDREWGEFGVDAAVLFRDAAAALRDARMASVVVYGERT